MTSVGKQPKHMTTSARGRAFITDWEGRHLTAYQDSAGIWTIGVGHTGPEVYKGMVITDARCDNYLRGDLFEAEREIQRLVHVPLTQEQFDALVSWEFNTGALHSSTLLRRLNAGRYDLVDNEMRRWNKATVKGKKVVVKGLVSRRLSESELWATGDYRTRNETTPFWESNTVALAPTKREVDKPLVQRKSVQGGTLAGVGVAGAALTDASNQLTMVVDYGDTIRLIFVIITLAGVALSIYASIKANKEKN